MAETEGISPANGRRSGRKYQSAVYVHGAKTCRGHITGWSGIIRVDGRPFTWMGGIPNTNMVNQVAYEYTSTKSVFKMHVDNKVEMNVTFLSPVTPDDFRRQSLVSSYLHVDVASMDGSTHNVQLYSDISAGTWCCLVIYRMSDCIRMGIGRPERRCGVGLRCHRWRNCVPQSPPADSAPLLRSQ